MTKEKNRYVARKEYLRLCAKDKDKVLIGDKIVSKRKFLKLMDEIGEV